MAAAVLGREILVRLTPTLEKMREDATSPLFARLDMFGSRKIRQEFGIYMTADTEWSESFRELLSSRRGVPSTKDGAELRAVLVMKYDGTGILQRRLTDLISIEVQRPPKRIRRRRLKSFQGYLREHRRDSNAGVASSPF
jgi:hypothetical protein